MSLTEYVDEIEAVVAEARLQYEELIATPSGAVLWAERERLADFTPQDLHWALERVSDIGVEVEERVAAIEPPGPVAELHDFYFDFGDDSFTAAQDALAVRASTAASWEELSATPEMEAYRAALARDKQWCADLDAQFVATADREIFADTPWIPGEMKEVVEAVLGCEGYPEHPEDIYRPPPTGPQAAAHPTRTGVAGSAGAVLAGVSPDSRLCDSGVRLGQGACAPGQWVEG